MSPVCYGFSQALELWPGRDWPGTWRWPASLVQPRERVGEASGGPGISSSPCPLRDHRGRFVWCGGVGKALEQKRKPPKTCLKWPSGSMLGLWSFSFKNLPTSLQRGNNLRGPEPLTCEDLPRAPPRPNPHPHLANPQNGNPRTLLLRVILFTLVDLGAFPSIQCGWAAAPKARAHERSVAPARPGLRAASRCSRASLFCSARAGSRRAPAGLQYQVPRTLSRRIPGQ